jgi:hypothetical protein
MGKIEKLLRYKLTQKAKYARLEPTAGCPSYLELTDYVRGVSDGAKKEAIEKHLSECFLCLDKIVSVYEGDRLLKKRKIKAAPKHVAWKAKNIDRISDDLIVERIDLALSRKRILPRTKKTQAAEKAAVNWLPKSLKKNRWLIASITAFLLSFAFPPVFLQFLLAAGILGGKWIFDSENAKTLIMIYNAWKKGGDKEAGEMLEALKDRIPNKKR